MIQRLAMVVLGLSDDDSARIVLGESSGRLVSGKGSLVVLCKLGWTLPTGFRRDVTKDGTMQAFIQAGPRFQANGMVPSAGGGGVSG